MISKASQYRRLNLDKISFNNVPASTDNVLKNVESIPSVSKINITKAEKDYKNRCVKLEISY